MYCFILLSPKFSMKQRFHGARNQRHAVRPLNIYSLFNFD
nr:MAG TPA: hypothetical protein [Caudoviricetes sp.]